MTYTVLARCPETHRIGIAIATFSLAVGLYNNGIKANVGGAFTQANVRQKNNALAINLLELGLEPDGVIDALKKDDLEPDYRQIAIVDRYGETAAFTGDHCRPWAGHVVGPGVVSFGNGLVGPPVIEAMRAAYLESKSATLEERLLDALEAGRDAGGQGQGGLHAPERSAALLVYGDQTYPDTDLRVDLHETAIEQLRHVHNTWVKYQDFYKARNKRPSQCMSVFDHLTSINEVIPGFFPR